MLNPSRGTFSDASVGRGNIDHVLVGRSGVLTIETKSQSGRIAVGRIDQRMLRQAYAQAKAVERITGRDLTPLLVFSRASLDRPLSRRRGVTILLARMLAGHLPQRRTQVTGADDIHRRLIGSAADRRRARASRSPNRPAREGRRPDGPDALRSDPPP